MEKNRKQAKNMLATTVLILNECLLAGKFLVLFQIIIITYFSTLFQEAYNFNNTWSVLNGTYSGPVTRLRCFALT